MDLRVQNEPLDSAAADRLIAALNAELMQRYPEEGANYFEVDSDEVASGRGAFLVAYIDAKAVGCGALRLLDGSDAEIKRMYVDPSFRGRGLGRAILMALEAEARSLGATRLVLETGERQPEALALYKGAGFVVIPCFGEYADAPLSLCMAKELTEATRPKSLSDEISVVEAVTATQLERVKELVLEYGQSLTLDLSFQSFDSEVSNFPGAYSPPGGAVFLALEGSSAVGCVCVRRLEDRIGEMKRLYVRPGFRGRGVGRRLAAAAIDAARRVGCSRMRLDTLSNMTEAIHLYQSLGFAPIEPYYGNPIPGAMYFELVLESWAGEA